MAMMIFFMSLFTYDMHILLGTKIKFICRLSKSCYSFFLYDNLFKSGNFFYFCAD